MVGLERGQAHTRLGALLVCSLLCACGVNAFHIQQAGNGARMSPVGGAVSSNGDTVQSAPERGFTALDLAVSNARLASLSGEAWDAAWAASLVQMQQVELIERPAERTRRPDQNFTLNVGHAIETLKEDIPLMFEQAPHMDIFADDIVLKDPKGTLSRGRRLYAALFASLRVLSKVTGMHPRVMLHSFHYTEQLQTLEARLSLSFGDALIGEPVKWDAISLYKFNQAGLIYEHQFDNVLKRHLWEYSHSWMGLLRLDSTPCPLACEAAVSSLDE